MLRCLALPLILAVGSLDASGPVRIVTDSYNALTEPPYVKMECRIVLANTGRQTLSHIKAQAVFFTPGNVLKAEHIYFPGPIYPDEVREWDFVTEFSHFTTDEVEVNITAWSEYSSIGGYI